MSLEGMHKVIEVCQIWFASNYYIDPSVVRGLEYYTGPVFEAELTFEADERRRNRHAFRLGRRRRAL